MTWYDIGINKNIFCYRVEFVLALDDKLKSTSGVQSVLLRTSSGISDEGTDIQSLAVESILWRHLDGLSVVVESLL